MPKQECDIDVAAMIRCAKEYSGCCGDSITEFAQALLTCAREHGNKDSRTIKAARQFRDEYRSQIAA